MTLTATAWYAFFNSSRWMTWNLFLALIPLALSAWLFRGARTRSLLWWLGLPIFIAFLPNAPYILTDVIHLVREIKTSHSLLISTLVIIPKYLLFVWIGAEAYALSLINLGFYLQKLRLPHLILPVELLLHGLSAIGIYLGRFDRFNSWDLLTHPLFVLRTLGENLLDHRALLVMTLTFLVTAMTYWLLKQVSLGVLHRYASNRLQMGDRNHPSHFSF